MKFIKEVHNAEAIPSPAIKSEAHCSTKKLLIF